MTAMQLAATVAVCLIVWGLLHVPGAVRRFARKWRATGQLVHDLRNIDPPAGVTRPDEAGNVWPSSPHGPVTKITQPCQCVNHMVRIKVDRCPAHVRPPRLRPVPARRDRKPGNPA
jgi:hypothetical protein